MDGLNNMPDDKHHDYTTRLAYKGVNFKSHQYQQSSSCKDGFYYTTHARVPRAATSSHSDSCRYRNLPPDTEETEVGNFQMNRQNNACHCCSCCNCDFNLRGAYRYSPCEESHSAIDEPISCDLHQIYDKIVRVSKWRNQRSCSGGYKSLNTVKEEEESPPVLAPQKEPPHTRDLARVISFKRLQMYQRLWKAQPAIGENFRFPIRHKVRQKMLMKDEVQLPHKVFVPNLYVVPTVKPRYNLRWAVRKCNHNYVMPPVGTFHDL